MNSNEKKKITPNSDDKENCLIERGGLYNNTLNLTPERVQMKCFHSDGFKYISKKYNNNNENLFLYNENNSNFQSLSKFNVPNFVQNENDKEIDEDIDDKNTKEIEDKLNNHSFQNQKFMENKRISESVEFRINYNEDSFNDREKGNSSIKENPEIELEKEKNEPLKESFFENLMEVDRNKDFFYYSMDTDMWKKNLEKNNEINESFSNKNNNQDFFRSL